MSGAFDFSEAYAGLKDFQTRTVNYVFQRMYQDDDLTRRFLVADEVGLGKTLVARGVIAKVAEHLAGQGVKRIDIIYICSNSEIARQNIRRLSLPGFENSAFSSRLTLLPLELHNLADSRLNFIAFTPGTALDLKGHMGLRDERAVLYWLLKKKWPDLVGTKRGPLRVFQGGMHSLKRFEGHVRWMRPRIEKIDSALAEAFWASIDRHDKEARRNGQAGFRERFEHLATEWAHKRSQRSWEENHERNTFVGDLRNLLAKTCVDALEPDLVILDEFQRFRHILDTETEAGDLARSLFDYTDQATETRALLLSATPYKMYTLRDESEEEDHYSDFLKTTEFLMGGKNEQFKTDLAEFSHQLVNLEPENLEALVVTKNRIEQTLIRVMCRTERLASSVDRNGMLIEKAPDRSPMKPEDLISYVTLDRVATELDAQSMMEYWKSAPYFPNFWDDYQVGRKFTKALAEEPTKAQAVQSMLQDGDTTLSWTDIERYAAIDPGSTRLRSLAGQLMDHDAWQLLWLPPSLPYYPLTGPFQKAREADLTKRLVFSAWTVVPKVVSTILSYEAERRMMMSRRKEGLTNTPEGRERFTEPLRFPKSRTSGMSAFAFIYPSLSLASLVDPLQLAGELAGRGERVSKAEILNLAESRISHALELVIPETTEAVEGTTDDRWYWMAPLLLDASSSAHQEWFDQWDLTQAWTGEEGRTGVGFKAHVDEAIVAFERARSGQLSLGSPPEDLGQILALLALGAPGTCAVRSLQRLSPLGERASVQLLNAASRVAWGFRSLFNTPEVTQLIRGLYKSGPYWQRALRYGLEGCLQATLDEYLHVLREFEGIVGDLAGEDLATLASTVEDVVSLRSSDLHAHDPLGGDDSTRRMRVRFALPFGQYRSEDAGQARRSGYVRSAFNSPFWPFVLTTTSVGQEGLDFHLYCHAVVHWNLPANPVDLEQREGRVHRYMGHALRKNLAACHSSTALNGSSQNPWASILASAIDARPENESDLVPYWIFPGGSKIERHVPRLPLSREEGRLVDLKRSLVLYRLVFGQPRQEELVELLKARFGDDEATVNRLLEALRVDLTPRVDIAFGR